MSKEAQKAHSVLHYIISKAVLEGKEMASEIALDLSALSSETEDVIYDNNDANSGTILRVKIETTWDTSNELIPIEKFVGEEDEPESGNAEVTDKDKSRH